MSRLEILQNSLAKKEKVLADKLNNHFDSVKSANGQPLNDKRNGQATMNKWDKQSQGIANQIAEIEKTKNAIEREKTKAHDCEAVKSELPQILLDLLGQGKITQWRKYPNRFFVVGVEKARMIYDFKTGLISHSYVNQIKDKGQFDTFKELYNRINEVHNKKQS